MVLPWRFHGTSIVRPWDVNGASEGRSWGFYAAPVLPSCFDGAFVVPPTKYDGLPWSFHTLP